jgi:hypothetical protein
MYNSQSFIETSKSLVTFCFHLGSICSTALKRDDNLLKRAQNSEHFLSGIGDLLFQALHIMPNEKLTGCRVSENRHANKSKFAASGAVDSLGSPASAFIAWLHLFTTGAHDKSDWLPPLQNRLTAQCRQPNAGSDSLAL